MSWATVLAALFIEARKRSNQHTADLSPTAAGKRLYVPSDVGSSVRAAAVSIRKDCHSKVKRCIMRK
jgi:hypothetical protein